jgi:hypothetical protein
MNRIRYFKRKVKELSLLTNVDVDIVTRKDDRLGQYTACVSVYLYCDTNEPVYLFRYNAKRIEILTKYDIINMVFHELGHIKFRHEFDNEKELEQMEYEAEKFAITNVKKHFSQYYNSALQALKTYETNDNQLYKKAFLRLYKEVTGKQDEQTNQ